MKYEEIPASLAKYIVMRDKHVAKEYPWSPHRVTEAFKRLLSGSVVVVGGRATCGTGKMDPTWRELIAWRQVVSKARSMGFKITEIPIKQPNASPTRSGGFWEESEYQLYRTPE